MNKEEILGRMDTNGYLWVPDASRFYDILRTYPEEGTLLEIGTGRCDSCVFWARVKPKWPIYTVDSYKVASDYIGGYGLEDLGKNIISWRNEGITNILPIIANSFDMPWKIPVDVLYIDGDHSYKAVKSDFEKFTPFLKPGGVVFMDDYTRIDTDMQVGAYLKKEVGPSGKWRVEPLEKMVIVWPK